MGAHLPLKGHDKYPRSHEYMGFSLFKDDWVKNITTEASVSENFGGGTADTNDNVKLKVADNTWKLRIQFLLVTMVSLDFIKYIC